MENSRRMNLTEGSVKNVLIKLTIPMIFGMLGLIVFNLVDTFWISRYGHVQMAALTYTFPVVLVINSLILGIGVGTSAAVSKAKGAGKHHLIQRYASDSLVLGVVVALVIILIGLLTMKPLFKALGADDQTLPYVMQYMRIWYLGVVFVTVPMIGNNSIRALGDTKTPSIVMLVAATVNIILDPILIFGWFGLPEMGVAGAALATVFSRFTTFSAALYVLGKREKVLSFKDTKLYEIFKSWGAVLYVGLPTAITRMIIPLATGFITNLMSQYGNEIVAGYGVAFRAEQFLLVVIAALSVTIGPFVGQNLGAKKFDRIKKARIYSGRFSMIFALGLYVLIFFLARPLATLFTTNDIIRDEITIYLRIVPIVYGLQGIYLISANALNTLRKPLYAALIGFIQMFVIYVPLAHLGSHLFGYQGVFIALAIAYALAGIIAHIVLGKQIHKVEALEMKTIS